MWRDSAFNYSIPYTKTFDPEIQGQISYADDDIYDNNYEQEKCLGFKLDIYKVCNRFLKTKYIYYRDGRKRT